MRMPGLLLLLVVCSSVSGQTLADAEKLWRAQDYQAAVKVFDAVLAANPKNADYRVRYGQFFFERFDPEEAAKLFDEAITLDPKNARAHLGLATVLADQFSGKATEEADKALELDPKLYEAHALKARMALEDDDPKKAAEEADAALAIDPSAIQAIAVHAAIELLRDKDSPWVPKIGNRAKGYETIAHFFVINRRYEDGIAYYRKAIAADPELWTAHSQQKK